MVSDGELTLAIHDALGRQVMSGYLGTLRAGSLEIQVDGRNDTGRQLASGVYFVQLRSSSGSLASLRLVKVD